MVWLQVRDADDVEGVEKTAPRPRGRPAKRKQPDHRDLDDDEPEVRTRKLVKTVYGKTCKGHISLVMATVYLVNPSWCLYVLYKQCRLPVYPYQLQSPNNLILGMGGCLNNGLRCEWCVCSLMSVDDRGA